MKNTCILLILCSLSSLKGFSQDPKITEIRNYYTEINELKARGEETGIPYYHMISQNYMNPGTGPQNIKTRYFFKYDQSQREEDNYDIIYEVVKIERDYNIAATKFHIEFLFKKGELIFAFKSTDSLICGNERYYFENGRVIKIIVYPFSDPCPDQSAKYEKTSGFGKAELENAESMKFKAANLKKTFENLPRE